MTKEKERRKGGEASAGQHVPPGGIVLVRDGTTLVAVAGPGVAVCFWNEAAEVACLAHFVEPATYDPSQATARYGNVALPTAISLIRESAGASDLEAQIFGGAFLEDGDRSGAEANIEMARKILSARGVKIVSEDVGGSKGRKIVFQGSSGHVAVVKVHKLRAEDWQP